MSSHRSGMSVVAWLEVGRIAGDVGDGRKMGGTGCQVRFGVGFLMLRDDPRERKHKKSVVKRKDRAILH